MLALIDMEMARNKFLDGLILAGAGFLVSAAFLYLQWFRRKTFLRFIEWDARQDSRLHLPRWWTDGWRRFAQSKAHTIIWSVLVSGMFLLLCVNFFGYLYARHHLHHQPSSKIILHPKTTAPAR